MPSAAKIKAGPAEADTALSIKGTEFLSNPEAMAGNRIPSVVATALRGARRACILSCIVGAAMLCFAPHAQAIIVGATPGIVPNTTVNPASYGAGWTQGDPGWSNSAHMIGSFNAIYLGDGWMLSANHTGGAGVEFTIGGTPYARVPNQSFHVSNSGVPDMSGDADLQLFRIQNDPGLPALAISSTPLNLNDQVMYIGYGDYRAPAESHWNVNTATDPDTWTQTTGAGTRSGYYPFGQGKGWGTNNIANDSIIGGAEATDGNITIAVANTTSYLTTFDRFSSNPFEAQAVGGDSGSPVFHKNTSGQWELAGITLANYIFNGQDQFPSFGNTLAVYDNATAFADLSSYRSNILAIMSGNQNYSVLSDLNLDGTAGANDDIAAFVAGWGYDNHTGQGTMASWKNGDLNHDGKTDVDDFLLMRSGLSASGAASLESMLGGSIFGSGVPEPTAILLAAGPVLFFAFARRSRRAA
jgi:hypothetical protein